MSQDEFTKLFTYMQKQFKELRDEIDSKASAAQVDNVLTTLDSIARNQETDQHERLAMNHQLERHEGWISQLADKADVKLGYE